MDKVASSVTEFALPMVTDAHCLETLVLVGSSLNVHGSHLTRRLGIATTSRILGAAPVIASVSLGATRRFVMKHREDASKALSLALPHGSLLVMAGTTQRFYRHALPRSARVDAPRINLTFRRITAP